MMPYKFEMKKLFTPPSVGLGEWVSTGEREISLEGVEVTYWTEGASEVRKERKKNV